MKVTRVELDDPRARRVWDAWAARGSIESPFLDRDWVASVMAAHGRDARLVTLVAEEAGEPIGLLPLHEERTRIKRVLPVRRLADPGVWFAPHGALIATRDSPAVAGAFLDELVRAGSWDVLEIGELVLGGPSEAALREACERRRLAFTLTRTDRSPYVALPGSWEEYIASRDGKTRTKIRRIPRRAIRAGRIEIRIVDAVADLPAVLPDLWSIERASWKAKAGTAITSRAWETAFYEALLPRLAASRRLELALLYVDGRPAAHYLGLIAHERYALLKVSYVEPMQAFGLGMYLVHERLRAHIEMGLVEHDFTGNDEAYKLMFCTGVREHAMMRIFRRRTVARALELATRAKTGAERLARRIPNARLARSLSSDEAEMNREGEANEP